METILAHSETLASDTAANLPGIDEYQILRLLGEGGAGTVYKARQLSTGQIVALKLLRQREDMDAAQAARLAARFERETQLCAQLHHPHIVRLLDKGQSASQQLFAVFEYVPGETLKDLLLKKGALTALEAGDLMGQVLDALACAHAQGIAHRDLKPQNIMVSTTGKRAHVKVLDFGIAAFIPERQKLDYRNLTMTQETMCSPSYSAPEQLRGEPPTVKIDLYAWGLLFIECLTGKPAIHGLTLAEIFHKQLSAMEVPLPPALLGHPLADLLRRVLRKNPLERAAGASALYDDFCKINLANIVGGLQAVGASDQLAAHTGASLAITREFAPGWSGLDYERQQITVLCCSLSVSTQAENETDLEALEAVQRDQLSLCADTASRYGGHMAGALGNSQMFYFGYPHIADDDARRAARAALEMVSLVRRRSALLAAQGFRLDLRVGLHTGIIRAVSGHTPGGLTPNTALQLERLATPGTVLASATTRKLLAQYVEFDDASQTLEKHSGELLPYFQMVGEYKAEAVFMMRSGNLTHGLVGREDELQSLIKKWEMTKAGAGQAVLLQGEAGIGKSRLSYEFCIALRQQAAITKEFRCLPEYQNNALYPVLEMLKNHLQLGDVGSPQEAVSRLQTALLAAGEVVEAVLPILCSWLSLPIPAQFPPQQFSPERQKRLLLDALQNLILQIGAQQPMLLLVEDVHWVDQTSLEFLSRLAQAMPGRQTLLLLTARPVFVAPWPEELVSRVVVGRLSEQAAEQLVGRLIAGKPIEPASLQRLCERTDGIPLFVEELTRMLLDAQMLVEKRGVYQLAAGFDTGEIPVTLRALLGARLTRLGAAKDTAQLAAAIGREFDYNLLAEVALVDEGRLQTDLEQLLAADLVYRQRRVQGDCYIFRHALIRDAAYDTMPLRTREQTHARIARQLEISSASRGDVNLSQLARHFAFAGEYGSAVQYGSREALIFLERALHEDVITLAHSVKQWITHLDASRQRAADLEISRILTNALMAKFGWADERVKEQTEHAVSLIEGIEDAQQTVPTLWAMAFYHHVASHRRTVKIQSAQLLQLSGEDAGLLAASHTMHGVACWIDGELPQSAAALDQVLRLYDPAQHHNHGYLYGLDSLVWALSIKATVVWFKDQDDAAAFALAERAVAYARELNHIPSLGIALMYQAFVHQYAMDQSGTAAVTSQLLELSQKYGLIAIEAYAAILHSWATSNLTLADQVLSGLQSIGCMLGCTHLGSLAAEIVARQGDYLNAYQRIQTCLDYCDQTEEIWYRPVLLRRRAAYRAHTAFADQAASRADLMQAIELGEAYGMLRAAQDARADLAG